jgi:hypothetical protein
LRVNTDELKRRIERRLESLEEQKRILLQKLEVVRQAVAIGSSFPLDPSAAASIGTRGDVPENWDSNSPG